MRKDSLYAEDNKKDTDILINIEVPYEIKIMIAYEIAITSLVIYLQVVASVLERIHSHAHTDMKNNRKDTHNLSAHICSSKLILGKHIYIII